MTSVKARRLFILAVIFALVGACNRVPDHVVAPDEMAALMADLHTAESVVDINYQQYETDSARLALKQAVLARHGVSQEQLDTSFMWYGSHLDKYMAVYEQTISILEDRLANSDAVVASQTGVSVAGDSVDVWTRPRQYVFNRNMGSSVITFHMDSDNNWKKGDSYTWRAKFFNAPPSASWTLVAEYVGGQTEVLNSSFGGEGWQQITFHADSTKDMRRVYGLLSLPASKIRASVYVDSIQLVRNRLDRDRYGQRYRQRMYETLGK